MHEGHCTRLNFIAVVPSILLAGSWNTKTTLFAVQAPTTVVGDITVFLLNHFNSVIFFFFCIFAIFFGPLPQHMEVPRLGVKLEL